MYPLGTAGSNPALSVTESRLQRNPLKPFYLQSSGCAERGRRTEVTSRASRELHLRQADGADDEEPRLVLRRGGEILCEAVPPTVFRQAKEIGQWQDESHLPSLP